MINLCKIALVYFFTAALSTHAFAGASDQPPVVKISSGAIFGRIDDGVYVFKGIPYAQAERFIPPEKPDVWEGVREATEFGPIAMQVNSWSSEDAMDEERLFTVNLWRQGLNDGKKRPVMFW